MRPVVGSSRVILFPSPKFGIQMYPSMPGAALKGIRLGARHVEFPQILSSLPCWVKVGAESLYSEKVGRRSSSIWIHFQTNPFKKTATSAASLSLNPATKPVPHGVAHKLDAIFPALCITPYCGHAGLKTVTNEAVRKQLVLPH